MKCSINYTDLEVRVREFARSVARREEGATAVEYGLMVALIAVVIIGAVIVLGDQLNDDLHRRSAAPSPTPDASPGSQLDM